MKTAKKWKPTGSQEEENVSQYSIGSFRIKP